MLIGAHQIVQAYCSLLRGEKITHSLHARPLLPLKTEVIEKCVEKIECHRIADLHKYSMNRTWIAGITALGKQIGRNICYPSARRIGKTLLVPRGQIQRWIEAAESKQAKVTEHDLLLAFIYKVSDATCHTVCPKLEKFTKTIPAQASLHLHTAHNFGLTIDISKQLQSEANLSNPWYMMPLPDPIPTSEYDSPSLVRLATHIRRAVHEGQQSECIAEIIAQHKNPT